MSAQQLAGGPLLPPRGPQPLHPRRPFPSWCRPGRPSLRLPGRLRPRRLAVGRPGRRGGCPRWARVWRLRARATTPLLWAPRACWYLVVVLVHVAEVKRAESALL